MNSFRSFNIKRKELIGLRLFLFIVINEISFNCINEINFFYFIDIYFVSLLSD